MFVKRREYRQNGFQQLFIVYEVYNKIIAMDKDIIFFFYIAQLSKNVYRQQASLNCTKITVKIKI